jgi:NAD(P)-dependent dehydrogenase (short-subunit alcohol dehydrogenase family)
MDGRSALLDHVAIVTGAGQGIGEAIAHTFAREGAAVGVADVNADEARRVVISIEENGGKAFALEADVTKSNQVDAMASDVVSRFGRIDILVNGAGGWREIQPVCDITNDEWNRLISLNLTSAFYCSRAAARTMIEQKSGRIISITSNAGIAPSPFAPSSLPYSAAKAGLIGMTKLLARDLGPHGITVNCVAPGTTLTPRVRKARDAESLKRIAASVPMRRLVEPQDAAEATLYLASKEARYVTGVTLKVNGGKLIS